MLVSGTTTFAPLEMRRRVSSDPVCERVSLLSIRFQSKPRSKVARTSPAGSSASGPSSVVCVSVLMILLRARSKPLSVSAGSGPVIASVPAAAASRNTCNWSDRRRRSISVVDSLYEPSKVVVSRKELIGWLIDPAAETVSLDVRRASGVSAPKVRNALSPPGPVSVTVLSPSRLRLSLRA